MHVCVHVCVLMGRVSWQSVRGKVRPFGPRKPVVRFSGGGALLAALSLICLCSVEEITELNDSLLRAAADASVYPLST